MSVDNITTSIEADLFETAVELACEKKLRRMNILGPVPYYITTLFKKENEVIFVCKLYYNGLMIHSWSTATTKNGQHIYMAMFDEDIDDFANELQRALEEDDRNA